MTIVETRPITGGVDSHLDVHVAAGLDGIGGLLGVESFATTAEPFGVGGGGAGVGSGARTYELRPTCASVTSLTVHTKTHRSQWSKETLL